MPADPATELDLLRRATQVHERTILDQRAEIQRLRAVVDAALTWRQGRDRDIIGTAPPGGQRSATGVALIDAVDAYLAG